MAWPVSCPGVAPARTLEDLSEQLELSKSFDSAVMTRNCH